MKYGGEPGYKGGKDLFLYPCAIFFFGGRTQLESMQRLWQLITRLPQN